MNLQQFLADPHFQTSTLTAAINEARTAPTLLASLGLFEERGITTTTFEIEFDGQVLTLVQPGERGQANQGQRKGNRRKVPFQTVHLPVPIHIKADEIQNVRAFGSQTEQQAVQAVVNQHLELARQRLVATREFMRAGAITGKIYDADGNLLLDVPAAFGITVPTTEYDPAAKKAKAMLTAGKTESKKYLSQAMVSRWMLMCGPAFFDAFSEADDVVKALANKNGNSNDLVNDMTDGLDFHNVTVFAYDASVLNDDGDEVPYIPADEAYLVPVSPGLLIGRNAPADFVETVGSIGLPFYAKTELAPMGKGIAGEAQSNPLYLATRPLAIRKYKLKAA